MSIISWFNKDQDSEIRDGIKIIYPRLWRYCLVLTGSAVQADDLVQAACLRALENASNFESGTHFDRWMFRLTQRLWINELRKQAVRTGGGLSTIEEADLRDHGLDQLSSAMVKEVLMSVMHLPEAQRAAIILVYVEGHSYRDAAMILDIPVGTIMSRLSVARSKLVQKFRSESEVG
ncbi:MAG: RNA polymerase sigma factor [Hyphomicrobiales bacterium]